MRILIVDDHAVNRKLLRAQLEGEGQTVLEAADGVEGLEILDREPVDAVISDILMPNMDGFRFCLEVRKRPKFNAVTFIFYTSTYDSPTDRQLAQTVGGDRYIVKPAPVGTLLATLREIAQQGTMRRGARREGGDTSYVLKQYNEALVAKLEQRNVELTERNQALQQAQQQLRLQATALETAANAILITDRTGAIQWVNPAFTALTGYTAPDVLGKTPRVLKSDKHDQAFYRELWKTVQSGRTWCGEFVNRRKDGTFFHDEHTITPVRSERGEITHFIGILHDVTARKRAEEELRLTHEKLRHLLAHSPAVIYTLKLDGQKITPTVVSDNIERLLGVTVTESARYEWWLECLHPEDRDRVLAVVGDGIKEQGYSTEYRMRHKDGTFRWIEDNNRVVRDAEGRLQEAVGVWSDITERKRAEETFRQRAAELERFHHLSVGRELQMIELKKEINELARQAGKPAPYDLSFLVSRTESSPKL